MASPLPLLPKTIRDARLPGGGPDTELINYFQNQARAIQQLQAGGGLPVLIAAIANLSPSANEFLRFTGTTTVETLTADEVVSALALVAADISDLGSAATGDIGSDVQAWDTNLDGLAALSFSNGDVLYYNSGLQRLAKGTDDQVLTLASGIPSWADASGGGGLVLEASDTADGTAEHLQVTATSTPSSIKRMEARFRSIVPEIDADTVTLTAILDNDAELTGTAYDYQFWRENAAVFDDGESTGNAGVNTGNLGNASGEYGSIYIKLIGQNGSQNTKSFQMLRIQRDATGGNQMLRYGIRLSTTNSIKGWRIDTNNAGDMIDEGEAELWVQT